MQPKLTSILAVPTESQEGMVAAEIRQPDLVAENGSRVAVSLTRCPRALLHASAVILGTAREPGAGGFASPASTNAIRVGGAVIAVDVVASEDPLLETGLQRFHIALVGGVSGVDELLHNSVVGADTV